MELAFGVVILKLLLVAALVALVGNYLWVRLFYRSEAPFVPSRRAAVEAAFETLEIGPDDVVYELGCGTGRFLFSAYRKEPRARYVGVEHDRMFYAYLLAKRLLHGNPSGVSIIRGDLFGTDLTEATKVYAYLLPEAMERLLPKALEELRGARLASLAFPFPASLPYAEAIRVATSSGRWGEHLLYRYDVRG